MLVSLYFSYNKASLSFFFTFSSKKHNAFPFENIAKFNVSIFDKNLADGFDLPIKTSELADNSNILNPLRFDKFSIKKSFALSMSGEDYIALPYNRQFNVYTIGRGTVVYSDNHDKESGYIVMILHKYFENGEIKYILSEYNNLKEVFVRKNDILNRHQKIGTFVKSTKYKSLHFEIRKASLFAYPVIFNPPAHNKPISWIKKNYESPTSFILQRLNLTLPSDEKLVVLVIKKDYKMELYRRGNLFKTYDIALSQEPGKKMNEGDNRTPEGDYKICQMFKGPFTEKDANGSGLFLGSRWIGISYPNILDAADAKNRGMIKAEEFDSIMSSLSRNEMPPKNTYLGGGIGIHGWKGDWPKDLKDITWGCVSMKQKDLEELYDLVSPGTIVIITK